MCGLSAIFAYATKAPPVDPGELDRITDRMAPRGPDGRDTWISADRRVGLGHRRLAIIDLSPAGAQPMARGALRITFNGEIYNYRDLRAGLEAKGVTFRTQTDTEVILALYEAEGAAMVRRLRGMFAFVLWDETRRGVLLARDPHGIKPLYYADDGATIRAASQVKALTAGGRCGGGADPAAEVGFLLFGYVPEPHTIVSGIAALPAGSTLWVDAAGRRAPEPYCDHAAFQDDGAGRQPLAEALRDSVRHHMVADVPVGVFLSAGLDSSTLVGLASELQGAGLDTFTLGFDEFRGTPRDEVPLAESVAAHYGTRHRTSWVEGKSFHAKLDAVLDAMDQPTIDGVNVYFVAREAARAGLKVALSGLGGDELFRGYDTFVQVPRLVGKASAIPGRRSLGTAFRRLSAAALRRFTSPKWAGLLEYGGDYAGAYLLRRGLFMPWELPEVLDPDRVRAGWEALDPLGRLTATQAGCEEPTRKVAALESAWYMRNQLLRDADWAGMAHSIEIRVPFVDAWLSRALAPVGAADGPSKRDMAATPAKPLPEAVLARPKTGFFVPVRDWLAAGRIPAERGLRGWARFVLARFSG